MNEQTKTKIIEAIDSIKFGTVNVVVRAGRVVDVSVQTSLDLKEKVLDKSQF